MLLKFQLRDFPYNVMPQAIDLSLSQCLFSICYPPTHKSMIKYLAKFKCSQHCFKMQRETVHTPETFARINIRTFNQMEMLKRNRMEEENYDY